MDQRDPLLAFIRRGRKLGFGLEDIRACSLWERREGVMRGCREIAAHHLGDIRPRSTISGSSKGCSQNNQPMFGSRVPDCPSWTSSMSGVLRAMLKSEASCRLKQQACHARSGMRQWFGEGFDTTAVYMSWF